MSSNVTLDLSTPTGRKFLYLSQFANPLLKAASSAAFIASAVGIKPVGTGSGVVAGGKPKPSGGIGSAPGAPPGSGGVEGTPPVN